MRRVFILTVLCLTLLSSGTLEARKQGRQLNDLLLSYMQLEDVHPDSLERNIDSLKQVRLQQSEPAARAVYAAAIARLYAERIAWRSVGNDLRDSMLTWYGLSLADKQVLAAAKAKRWKPFVVVGKDEKYFAGDMLNVVWRSMVADVAQSVRDTCQMLPKYGEIVDFYRTKGLNEGAFLMSLDSLYDKRDDVKVADLLALRDRYAQFPICAELYLRLSELSGQTPKKQREWLQQGLTLYPKYRRRAALQNALTRLSDPTFFWEGPIQVYPGKQYQWRFTVRNLQSVTINGEEHVFPKHDPVETFSDTLLWTAPKAGEHELVFVPRPAVKVTQKPEPQRQTIRSTALQAVYQILPDGKVQMIVVDSDTGQPQSGVVVRAYKPASDEKDTVQYFAGHTDKDGKIRFHLYRDEKVKRYRYNNTLRYRLSTPTETDLPIVEDYMWVDGNKWKGAPTVSTRWIRMFSDRAIYRPGQTVHVSGIAYRQLDWEYNVQAGEKVQLNFYDSQRKKLDEKTVETDAMGVFSCDFTLPEKVRNGQFCVSVPKSYADGVYFRVEEYKRPTFEVVLDDSLHVVGDSCEVRGTAKNYDGSPLRGARVTGTYLWQIHWLYTTKRSQIMEEAQPLDTIETDDNGHFAYRLKAKDEALKVNRWRPSLRVEVDVLSQQGETHNARHFYWRSLEPAPKPTPHKIDSTFIVNAVVDTFSIDRPGRIEIITNLHDVYLYYTFAAAGEIWKEDIVRIDNETFALDIPYREEYDQSLTASFCFVKKGHIYTSDRVIYLRQPDKRLQAHWDTFRDLVQPGQQEEWRLTLRRPDGTPADANLMVAMYDASLDYFINHEWNFQPRLSNRTYRITYRAPSRYRDRPLWSLSEYFNQKTKKERVLDFTHIDDALFQVSAYTRAGGHGPILYKANSTMRLTGAAPMEYATLDAASNEALQGKIAGLSLQEAVVETKEAETEEMEAITVPMRENFDETAFFMPQLRTDKNGQVSISFTLPESLTRWNLLGIAHTQDMMYANLREQIEARKDLMAQLYLPRFLRPGDEAVLTATVRNVGEQAQQGKGVLQILDAKNEKILKQWKSSINLAAQKDTVLHFEYQAAEGDVIVRWAVEGTTCSDGEQRLLPVLSPTEHVTNTIPITAYNPGVTNIDLSNLFPAGVTNRQLTVEYTTHPEQYALQALPVLAQAKHNDVLSIAAAYYAGELGKALGVEMSDSTEEYLQKLQALQDADGGFRWYPQMPTNAYLTREVSFLLTRLRMLTGKSPAQQVNDKAVHYLLAQRIDSTYFSTSDLRNLYVALWSGASFNKEEQKKVDFLLRLAKKAEPEDMGYEGQALLALVWNKAGEQRKARKCIELFKKYIVSSPERGSYIEFPKGSFTSIDRILHIHVQLMEALKVVQPDETQLLSGMRRYLLQQKRTQEWSTPVNSANAVFALMYGREKQETTALKDLMTLTSIRGTKTNFTAKDDTLGYLRDSLEIDDKHLPKGLRLHKFSDDESWGAVFADFEQRFDQIEAQSAGLSIRQQYPQQAKTGSRYKVRYYLTAERDYEYVTLIVPRPAFTEPVDMRSGYRWGGGLGYYRQVHDATTEFSFCQIPRGEYLIEETLYVERDGRYHSGIAVIRCEYADEFQGHSSDDVVEVKN